MRPRGIVEDITVSIRDADDDDRKVLGVSFENCFLCHDSCQDRLHGLDRESKLCTILFETERHHALQYRVGCTCTAEPANKDLAREPGGWTRKDLRFLVYIAATFCIAAARRKEALVWRLKISVCDATGLIGRWRKEVAKKKRKLSYNYVIQDRPDRRPERPNKKKSPRVWETRIVYCTVLLSPPGASRWAIKYLDIYINPGVAPMLNLPLHRTIVKQSNCQENCEGERR